MRDLVLGRLVRAVRRQRGWRQLDCAAAAEVHRSTWSRLELGNLDRLSLATLRACLAVVAVRLELAPRWRGGEADRLMDEDHAAMTAALHRRLDRWRWLVKEEVSFNHYGDRGSCRPPGLPSGDPNPVDRRGQDGNRRCAEAPGLTGREAAPGASPGEDGWLAATCNGCRPAPGRRVVNEPETSPAARTAVQRIPSARSLSSGVAPATDATLGTDAHLHRLVIGAWRAR